MSREISRIGRSGAEATILATITFGLLGILLLPIVVVAVMSITPADTVQFPPPGASLKWYRQIWDMLFGANAEIARLWESLRTSLLIAAITGLVCVIAGVPASYALARYRFRGKALAQQFINLPIIFPAIVLGVALLIIVSALPFDLGLWQIVIAHTIVTLPFMIRNVSAALEGLDGAYLEAAKTLGASNLRAFAEVVLPLIRGGIVSGLLLVFVLSFNEFTLTYFLYTVDVYPLSMWLFQQSNTSLNPSIFAVSTLIIVLNVFVVLVLDRVAGSRDGAV